MDLILIAGIRGLLQFFIENPFALTLILSKPYTFLKYWSMQVERKGNEVIVKLDGEVNVDFLQNTLDYLRYLELGARSNADQQQIDEISNEVKEGWWSKNRDKFL